MFWSEMHQRAMELALDIYGPELTGIYEVGLKAFRRAKEIFVDPQVRTEPGWGCTGSDRDVDHPW